MSLRIVSSGPDHRIPAWPGAVSRPWADLGEHHLELIVDDLAGRTCTLDRHQARWSFEMGEGRRIVLAAPWRIVADNRIMLGDFDEGRWFGMDERLDCARETGTLLSGARIEDLAIDACTGDLKLMFEGGKRIDVFNPSSGEDGWWLHCRIGTGWASVVGSGGGYIRVTAIQGEWPRRLPRASIML